MITSRIQIGSGEVLDTYQAFGLMYLESNKVLGPPIKTRQTTSYAEEAGEHVDPRTVFAAFDYEVTFLVEGVNMSLTNVNARINAFNAALYQREAGSDILKFKPVTLYDDYRRIKVVGIPTPISECTDFYRMTTGELTDFAVVTFKIRVTNPNLCDFNTNTDVNMIAENGNVLSLENGAAILIE